MIDVPEDQPSSTAAIKERVSRIFAEFAKEAFGQMFTQEHLSEWVNSHEVEVVRTDMKVFQISQLENQFIKLRLGLPDA